MMRAVLWRSQQDTWQSPVGVGRLGLDRRAGLAGLLKGGGGPHALREEAGRPFEKRVLVSVDAAEPEAAGDVGPSESSWGLAWPRGHEGLLVQAATGWGSCGWVGQKGPQKAFISLLALGRLGAQPGARR